MSRNNTLTKKKVNKSQKEQNKHAGAHNTHGDEQKIRWGKFDDTTNI